MPITDILNKTYAATIEYVALPYTIQKEGIQDFWFRQTHRDVAALEDTENKAISPYEGAHNLHALLDANLNKVSEAVSIFNPTLDQEEIRAEATRYITETFKQAAHRMVGMNRWVSTTTRGIGYVGMPLLTVISIATSIISKGGVATPLWNVCESAVLAGGAYITSKLLAPPTEKMRQTIAQIDLGDGAGKDAPEHFHPYLTAQRKINRFTSLAKVASAKLAPAG